MTPREAFKIGFMEKCAADGLTPEQTLQRIRHLTFIIKSAEGSIVGDSVKTMGGIWKTLWPLLLAAPPVAGLAGGAYLAQMNHGDMSTDEAKKQEELAEYRRAIDAMAGVRERQKTLRA